MVRANRDTIIVTDASGHLCSVNQSGQLAVESTVNVGATTVNISGETMRVTAAETSGTFPNIYVTHSGQPVSGIPYRLVVAFSGDNVIAAISGQTVVTSVSGNVVVTAISGETVRLISGHNNVNIFAFDPSGLTYNQLWVDNSGGHKLQAVIDAGAISVQVSGNVIFLASGFNTVSLVSGVNVVKVSGESVVVRSGLVEIASGRVSVSGSVVSTSVSGNVVIAQNSGQTIRLVSGHNTVAIQAFDLSGLVYNNLAVDTSGGTALKIAGSLSASTDISGQIVRAVQEVSGHGQVGGVETTSGVGIMGAVTKMTFYKAYPTLSITQLSGGTQLLSGNSLYVRLKNTAIATSGIANSVGCMYVGSSGTGNAPWANTTQSGHGLQIRPGETVEIPIDNPNKLRVVVGPSQASGQWLSYAVFNYNA